MEKHTKEIKKGKGTEEFQEVEEEERRKKNGNNRRCKEGKMDRTSRKKEE